MITATSFTEHFKFGSGHHGSGRPCLKNGIRFQPRGESSNFKWSTEKAPKLPEARSEFQKRKVHGVIVDDLKHQLEERKHSSSKGTKLASATAPILARYAGEPAMNWNICNTWTVEGLALLFVGGALDLEVCLMAPWRVLAQTKPPTKTLTN